MTLYRVVNLKKIYDGTNDENAYTSKCLRLMKSFYSNEYLQKKYNEQVKFF